MAAHRRWQSSDDGPHSSAQAITPLALALDPIHSPPPLSNGSVLSEPSPAARVPPSPGLRLQTTNLASVSGVTAPGPPAAGPADRAQAQPASHTPDMTRSASASSYVENLSSASPSSYSPAMDTIQKMTPLPSPIVTSDSPGPWNKFRGGSSSQTPSRKPSFAQHRRGQSVLVTASGESLDSALAAEQRRKACQGLRPEMTTVEYPMNKAPRSDFDSNSLSVPRTPHSGHRHSSNGYFPGNDDRAPWGLEFDPIGSRMRREKCLAQRRRTISSAESSPAYTGGSTTSLSSISSVETPTDSTDTSSSRLIKKQKLESFEAQSVGDGRIRRWRGIRLLGQGAFSKVILATAEDIPEMVDDVQDEGVVVEEESRPLNPRKFVAVKIVEHGAAGGASKERVESGLKRELDILKSVNHPCLVRLKAYSIEKHRALLVLPYCAGGDLFDVASDPAFSLSAPLIRRMFAEILSAVRYLHRNGIVHRDVKLENVLINLTRIELSRLAASADSVFAYPHPITTLTDVGLSRRVDFDSDDHLLTTRCGSDDYAAPELIMGQPYDGRATDAWALGVLLYALMEGRLPFDPPPGGPEQKMRSKTAHRIARCEWKWIRLSTATTTATTTTSSEEPGGGGGEGGGGEADGEHRVDKAWAAELEGGKRIVEGLLKRTSKRWKLDAVEADEWVKGAILGELTEWEEFEAPLV